MLHAELSVFWLTAGLPGDRWAEFLAWLRTKASPGSVADINCSYHWLDEFGMSLCQTVSSRTAGSLHAVVPALGLPSDFVRVIDVVTVAGISTLPVVAIHTSHEGKLTYSLLGCPSVGGKLASGSSTDRKEVFRTHGASKLVELVHSCERRMCVHRMDRVLRLAMTMADGAIQGPGSIQLEAHEAAVDRRERLHEGVCQFHRLDGAGNLTDSLFPATSAFDRFLRLVRQRFAFGTGALILRGVATKFRSIAEDLQRQADGEAQAASGADVEGEHMKSHRLRRASEKHAAHAANMRKAGWTEYRRPLAPKDNGTRKVVWQSQSRRRLFDIFALVYWGLRARMVEAVEQAKFTAERQGHRVTARIGERTAQMKLWRAMGRTLFDIRLFVFNLGRADFRSKHTTPIALVVEGTTYSAIETQVVCMEFSFAMFRSSGALLDIRAIITLLEALLEPTAYARPNFQKSTVWATAKTLFAHRAWRHFPGLTRHLPHILLGGTMQGIDLHSGVFDEPKDAAATGASPTSHRQRWLDNRKERFAHVLGAVDELVDWVKTERRHFIERVLGVPPTRTTRRCKRNAFVDIDEAERHVQWATPAIRDREPDGADVQLGPTPDVAGATASIGVAPGGAATDGGHWRQCISEEREARDLRERPAPNPMRPRGFRRKDLDADLAGEESGAASGATSSGAAPGATPRGAASGASPSEAPCDKGWLDSDIYSMSKVELDIVQKKPGSSDEEAIVDSLWREVCKAAPQCLPGRDCDEEEIANDSDTTLGDTSSGEDDIGTPGEVGLPPGSAESACPNQSEAEAPRSEDWVMVTSTRRPLAALESGGQSGAAHIVPWSTWRGQKEKDIVAGLPPRERALMSYSRIFAGGALTNTELDEESLRPYVELVFNEFSGKLWPLREDDIAKPCETSHQRPCAISRLKNSSQSTIACGVG